MKICAFFLCIIYILFLLECVLISSKIPKRKTEKSYKEKHSARLKSQWIYYWLESREKERIFSVGYIFLLFVIIASKLKAIEVSVSNVRRNKIWARGKWTKVFGHPSIGFIRLHRRRNLNHYSLVVCAIVELIIFPFLQSHINNWVRFTVRRYKNSCLRAPEGQHKI